MTNSSSPNPPIQPGTTSETLIVRIKQHDEAAWRRLVELYSRLVLYWCRSQNVPRDDRRDILQDVFRAAFASIDTFSKSKPGDTFRGWLRTVTRSRVAEYYRTKSKLGFVQSDVFDSLAAEPDADEEEKEENILIRRARKMVLNKVDEKTRKAVELLLQGYTSAEVGEQLGMKPGAVRQAKRRIKEMLREFDGLLPHLAGTPAPTPVVEENEEEDSLEET